MSKCFVRKIKSLKWLIKTKWNRSHSVILLPNKNYCSKYGNTHRPRTLTALINKLTINAVKRSYNKMRCRISPHRAQQCNGTILYLFFLSFFFFCLFLCLHEKSSVECREYGGRKDLRPLGNIVQMKRNVIRCKYKRTNMQQYETW